MWLNWLPWRFLVRHVARVRGFVDPISVLSHLHRFAQPSQVAAPLELLRAGVVFHARGLMNTGAIQHNLDWVWPYWVERQFDPHDEAFIPRAFSITHVNLTHRNWTAVGLPDLDWLPIVDPRGLLTPYWDGWSIDTWIIADDGCELIPSRLLRAAQRFAFDQASGVRVVTQCDRDGLALQSDVEVLPQADGTAACRLQLTAVADRRAWIVVGLRPYNPEGVKFVHQVALADDRRHWNVEGEQVCEFSLPVERHVVSSYRQGDVKSGLLSAQVQNAITCDVGMATAAAMFRLEAHQERRLSLVVPYRPEPDEPPSRPPVKWPEALAGHARLRVPDGRFQFLYDAAIRTLVLHSSDDVYPGPYTYKRFWYRDAAFILHAMLCAGLTARARRGLDRFPLRQTGGGYFRSQEGEWDSNGEALWLMHRYCQLTGQPPPPGWRVAIERGARWIIRKRLADELDAPHAGLLPAGFSAEHLGPNDYYYWDDFWSVAGLRAAAALVAQGDQPTQAGGYLREAERLMTAIQRSLTRNPNIARCAGVPASPYRRMDAGAIGSIVAGYPLDLWAPTDPRLLETVEYLVAECFYKDGFFQDMIHSGINAYLTLHVAQVELRAGNPRFVDHMNAVARLASPTGQWPEAIHPRTLGGCMGDGQHVWAAAEWIMMLRNCFVREDGGRLIMASGIPAAWLDCQEPLEFGPAPTPWGPVNVQLTPRGAETEVHVSGQWRGAAPPIEVRLVGCPPLQLEPGCQRVICGPAGNAALAASVRAANDDGYRSPG